MASTLFTGLAFPSRSRAEPPPPATAEALFIDSPGVGATDLPILDSDPLEIQIELPPATQMDQAETELFHERKAKILDRSERFLRFLHVSDSFIQKTLEKINLEFIRNAALIGRANSVGGIVTISAFAGLGLPRRIVESLRQRRWGSLIPKSGGFYYLFSSGVSFLRKVDQNQKSQWILEFFADSERLLNSMTGVAEAGAALNYGVTYDVREQNLGIVKSEVNYGGALGFRRRNEDQYSLMLTTAASLPPVVASFMLFNNQSTRFYLVRI